ncbi:Chaperone protein DnaJ [Babesia sp. Xinjiang]|uniref:Chaperone protein DnaJ n=1 Tax=Babesia sp. Xinjiang TaxID=462227 RepID=UPI000A2428B4|nr:Chaperone protein DnaJ [Babesia sp. Xinjiang]ORM39764.1 Chaperone protein DnaJ [Babesia sp. Xinjiang]
MLVGYVYRRLLKSISPRYFLVNIRTFSIYTDELPQAVKSGRITHYDVLQVPRNANTHEIKQAYLKLVKIHHPDANIHKCSPAVFIAIKDAHDILTDTSRRKTYDISLTSTPQQQKVTPTVRPRAAQGAGYEYMDEEAYDQQRWERYSRYVRGERADDDDRYLSFKTMCALSISAATVFGMTLFANEMFNRFKDIGTEDDDDDLYISDMQQQRLVKAYYNPVSKKWERILDPFVAPSPSVLLQHYRDAEHDEIDDQAFEKALPKQEFIVLDMPFSQTHRPTLLWDKRSSQVVVFRE